LAKKGKKVRGKLTTRTCIPLKLRGHLSGEDQRKNYEGERESERYEWVETKILGGPGKLESVGENQKKGEDVLHFSEHLGGSVTEKKRRI